MSDKNSQEFDLRRVESGTAMLKEIISTVRMYLDYFVGLSDREKRILGSLCLSLTSPWEIGEFDATIGDNFQIDAGINRLFAKVKAGNMQRVAAPTIFPATGGGKLPN